MDYSLYEWVAVIVTTSGLIISGILGFIFLKKWLQEKKSRKKRML
jgi:heme exporter protein D